MPLEDGDAAPREVLLVVSDTAYRSALGGDLRSVGLRPIEAATPMEALTITDQTPGISLLVVDFDTPPGTLHAVAFARMAKTRNRAAKVLLAVLHADDADQLDDQDLGIFDGVLVKGDHPATLAAILGTA
jgi:DNA-binding NtrC family response regulator